MPRYFFHLISPEERSDDESGCELPNAERAYLEVYQAALDISFEMLRTRRDPSALRFEVMNDNGDLLFDLPFVEALRPTRRVATTSDLHTKLHRGFNRQRELTSALRDQFQRTKSTIQETRDLLARPLPR
ncbi:MAG: hypothetical protein JO000_22660 [Alphaproteobacteria bacterium]|nr:hypothetical protein [Alphaproteobacteria bacterium]